ncbi:30S ribosomal protein S20 [Hydrogenothermus marinus]|uniref:Small ribosomal subunit protein bS20 n=1 Tax=Hydrogenothermus marinus TaxID=133270 RepID=A0A3M0BL66_9AQUI|nr:30S ribosomal protein S20 [Hydrogenothermus marinus]RMA97089.1 small subunit ribosomal protein S20 [Hydrogenothermus marinus]
MAHTRNARKRVRQAEKRRLINRYHISRMRTAFKRIREALKEGDIAKAESLLPTAQKIAYRAAAKGAIHKNEAARRVSRYAQKINKAKALAK